MPANRVELKYCEGCGALRVRPASDQTTSTSTNEPIYCASCARVLAPRPKRRAASPENEGGRR